MPPTQTRGMRDARDVIDAAVEQGWILERPKGRNCHYRLIPPGDGIPVGISSTPSDCNYRHQIIRRLKKSGFIWEPLDKKKETAMNSTEEAPPVEQWSPIAHCKAEVSNGGMIRHSETHRIIKPAENGIVRVFSESGFTCEKSVRGEVRRAFGHSPIKALFRPELFEATNKVPKAPEPPRAAFSLNGHAEWQPVLIEGVREGYEVNKKGVVIPPAIHGSRLPIGRSQHSPISKVFVTLRLLDGRQKRLILDEIVLEAYKPRPGEGFVAKHLDGDEANCDLSNLEWVEGRNVRIGNRKKETDPVPTPVVDPPVTSASMSPEITAVTPVEQQIAQAAIKEISRVVAFGDEVISYHVHVYKHVASDLQLTIMDGKVSLPEVTQEQLPILALLLAEHQK